MQVYFQLPVQYCNFHFWPQGPYFGQFGVNMLMLSSCIGLQMVYWQCVAVVYSVLPSIYSNYFWISNDFWIIWSEIIKESTSTYSRVNSEFNGSLKFWEYSLKRSERITFFNHATNHGWLHLKTSNFLK